jgi:hypothetical protein
VFRNAFMMFLHSYYQRPRGPCSPWVTLVTALPRCKGRAENCAQIPCFDETQRAVDELLESSDEAIT